jgi:hypothetical protein
MIKFTGVCVVIALFAFQPKFLQAQQQKGAHEAATTDSRFIVSNIDHNEGVVFLSRKGKERAQDEKVRELADQMVADYISILYEYEQLNVAGGHANQPASTSSAEASEIYSKISTARGDNFDTLWVSNLLLMQTKKYDELSAAKDNMQNPQLNMVIKRTIPVIKKNVTQLKTLQRYLLKMDVQRKKELEKANRSR